VITSQEAEEYRLITRVYDVRNLVKLVPVPYWGGGFVDNQPTIVYQYDFNSLVNMIMSTLEPSSWDEVGGAGSVKPYYTRRMRVIVVSQTYSIHRKLQALLDDLAEHGGATPLPEAPAAVFRRREPAAVDSHARQPTGRRSGLRSSRLRTTGQ
jgi:hypothetical protein